MKEQDDILQTGISIEAPERAGKTDSEAVLRVNAAWEAIEAGKDVDANVEILQGMASSSFPDTEAAFWSCIYLHRYYRRKNDMDRSLYYGRLARDIGGKPGADPAWRPMAAGELAVAVTRTDNADEYYDLYLEAIRGNDRFGIREAIRKIGGITAHMQSRAQNTVFQPPLYWGLLYLAYRKWSEHPENTDPLSRNEARDKATLVLQDVYNAVSNARTGHYLYRNDDEKIQRFFPGELTIAAEGDPNEEELKLLVGIRDNMVDNLNLKGVRTPEVLLKAGYLDFGPNKASGCGVFGVLAAVATIASFALCSIVGDGFWYGFEETLHWPLMVPFCILFVAVGIYDFVTRSGRMRVYSVISCVLKIVIGYVFFSWYFNMAWESDHEAVGAIFGLFLEWLYCSVACLL